MALLKSGTRIYGNATIDTNLSITGNTVSSNYQSGALVVAGGVGIAGNVYINANLNALDTVITGNLTVTGTTTTVNSSTTQLEDPIIDLGNGANGTALTTNDNHARGLSLHYYNGAVQDAFMGWDTANGQFALVNNASISGGSLTINTYGDVKANGFYGYVEGIANLSQLTVNGISRLGNVGNIKITGGTSGYILTTDGQGNLTWSNPASEAFGNANISGSNTQVFFNNGNSNTLGTSANFTFTNTNNTLTVDNIVANGSGLTSITGANVTGTVANATYSLNAGNAYSIAGSNVTGQVSNALIAGTVYTNAQPNITSIGTLTSLAVTGNITAGNVSGGNLVSANYFVGNGSLLTGLSQLTSAVDNFTGDGTTTIFSLSATPGNVDYTFVSIGGVMQPRSYYSVSGSSLTFTTAPPATSIVEVTTLGGSVTGQTANANYANFAGNVVNSAQPNITSVGTLTSLNAVLPQVSNVTNASGIVTYNPSNNQLSYGPQSWFQGGLSSAITPTTSTDYVILWNNNNDPIGMGNTSTGHVVPGRTGWYMVTLRLTLSTNGSGATGQVNSQIRVNSTQELFSQCTSNHAQYNGFTFMNTGMVYLSSITDYITTTVYVTTSGQQISGGSSSSLVIQWISN